MCTIDKHADDRARKRNGFKRKAIKRDIVDAQKYGKSILETNGKLRKYLEKKQNEYSIQYEGRQYCRVKGDRLYWFLDDVNGDSLITAVTIGHGTTHYNKQQYGF